jgi:hypothetical protein
MRAQASEVQHQCSATTWTVSQQKRTMLAWLNTKQFRKIHTPPLPHAGPFTWSAHRCRARTAGTDGHPAAGHGRQDGIREQLRGVDAARG